MGKDLFNPHLRKFSIRKLNVGVCSVLLSTLILLGTAANAAADELPESSTQGSGLVNAEAAAPRAAVTEAAPAAETAQPAAAAPAAEVVQAPAAEAQPTAAPALSAANPATEVSAQVPASPASQPAGQAPASPVAQAGQPTGSTPAENSSQSQSPAAPASTSAAQPATKSELNPSAQPATEGTEAKEAAQPVRRTPGYAVNPVPTPTSSAMPRPTNQGQPLPQGTGFRNTGATGVTPGSGPAGADDATATARVPKPDINDSVGKRADELAKQITWLDFSDTNALTNLDTDGSLKVGTVFSKEISPGYRITLTVTELKPFQSTDIYKKRVEGTGKESTYDPNAENSFITAFGANGRPAKIKGYAQDYYSSIRTQGGLDTKGRKTQLLVKENGASYGAKFKVEAVYNGRAVKPTIVMADGEEANPGEFVIFTTNGQGWEYLAEWRKSASIQPYKPMDKWITNQTIFRDTTVDWLSFISPDQTTGGLGSQVFGPNVSKGNAVPIVMTRGASEVAFYVASSGQQAAMVGVMIVDGGDAPESYGQAYHTIANQNALSNPGTTEPLPQPYLGDVAADVDVDTANDWHHDDNENAKDEGYAQLLTADQFQNSNDLLDLDKAANGTYTLKIKAGANNITSPNPNPNAYVKAWVDFNQDGKFDDNEGSQVTTVTTFGEYTLNFNAVPGLSSGLAEQLGFRVRIATNQADIEKPTGVAFSGEVEDFQIHRVRSPEGEKQTSFGFKGENQTATVHFRARGVEKADLLTKTTLTNAAPQVLDSNGSPIAVSADGSYKLPEGSYRLQVNGDDVQVTFTPNANFTGQASGINIRRTDSNGASTGWNSTESGNPNVNDQLNNMDGRFVPTVLQVAEHDSTDAQGLNQVKNLVFNDAEAGKTPVTPDATRPAQFLGSDGNPSTATSLPAMSGGQQVGTYELDQTTGAVTFKPNKDFVGSVDPVTVEVKDTAGVRHRASYQPTVTKVTPTGQDAASEGIQGAEQSGQLTFNPGDSRVPIDSSKLPTFDNGQQTKTVADVGTYTVDSTGKVTFQPLPTYSGKPAAETVKRVDANGTEVTASYQADVKAAQPTGQNAQTSGLQGQLQSSHVTFTPGQATVNGSAVSVPLKTDGPKFVVNGQVQTGNTLAVYDAQNKLQGTYTLQSNGDISFQPEADFYGTPTAAQLQIEDQNGTIASASYQPTVTQVTPTAVGDATTGKQGQVQSGQVTFTPGHASVGFPAGRTPLFDNDSTVKEIPDVGKFEIDAQGKVTFTPVKTFTGPAPAVEVHQADVNGTVAKATYQATVTAVTPTGDDVETTGKQGQVQTGTPVFTEGDPLVPLDNDTPATFEDGTTKKEVPNVGTFEVAPNGTVTFTPDKQYVGSPDPVTVKRVDKNGTEVTAKYTVTVEKVTPTATNAESTGKQGQTQTGKPTFKEGDSLVPLDDTKPMTFEDGQTSKTVTGQGTYTIGTDGVITFVPEKQFTGKATPVTVKRVDVNGTEVTATYTPDVTAVTPTGKDTESTGKQGQVQTGTPVFTEGDPAVPLDNDTPAIFEDGTTKKEVPNVGTFEVGPDGTVTFTPDKQYVGSPEPVTVKRVDKNGTEVTAKYKVTVEKVTPTAVGDATTGKQGQVQSGQVTFTPGHASVGFPAGSTPLFDNDSTVKEIPDVGKFEIDAQGKVTFTPVKTFTGPAPAVEVHQADVNGTVAKATYQATVTAVTPTGDDVETTGKQGQVQTGTPVFTEGDPAVPLDNDTPATFEDGTTKKEVPNVGTFEVAPDGTVTFIPEKQYVGSPDPVTVKRVDKNGTEVTAKYTVTVEKVTPTATNAESSGKQGQVQTGTPVFTEGDPLVPLDNDTPATFEDGTTKKEVPNVGTFEVAPDGTVTFTPDKQYVGSPDPVTVKRVDKNGTEVTAKYTVTVEKVTPTGQDAESTGKQGQIQTGTPVFTEGDPAVPLDNDTPATFEDGSTRKEVPNIGTFEVAPDGTVTFTPDKQYVGSPDPVTVKRVDKNGTEVTAKYTVTVEKVTPTGDDVSTTGKQGQVQTGTPVFTEGDPLVPLDNDTPATFEDGSTKKEVPNVGTFEVAPNGTVTFTPEKQYVGSPDPVTVKRVDKNGTEVTAKYTVTVEKVTPTGKDAESTGKQGQVQTGTPVFTEGDPLVPMDNDTPATFEDGSTRKEVPNVGTFEVAPDGTVTFTPDKQYVGSPDPVTVKRVDKNGTEVTAKYTVTVEKVTPTGQDAESTGKQGQIQTGTPVFTEGDPLVPLDIDTPATFEDGSTRKEVPNIGTFEVAPDGTVTFTPDKQYVGSPDPVTVKRVDKNGTEVTAKYTVTVEKVTPTGKDAESTGKQGQTQTGTPVFIEGDLLVPLDNDTPATFEDGSTRKEVPNVGTFEVAPNGTVTFTPEKQYVGTPDPVTVKRVDKNGTEVTAKYTVTVEKVTPTGQDAESTGKQGQIQTGTPVFTEGDPLVPLDIDTPATFEDGSTRKEVPNIGTFEVAPDGTVTFTPDKQYVGSPDSVTVKRVDKNGTEVTAKYTVTVEKVTPTGKDAESTGKQGQVQTGTPVFTEGDPAVPMDNDTPATFDDGSTHKEVPNVGTFEVALDGTVTFTPDKQYFGSPDSVTVKRVDKNGTEVTAKYTVTVEKVTPTGQDAESTGKQGQVQTGTPVFTEGDPLVPLDNDTPATFDDGSTRKEVPNVGTFEVAPNGTVTFTPDKQYVGSPDSVTVKRVDKNGTEVTATYIATVEKVTPTGTDVRTANIKGMTQTGTPIFEAGDPAVPLDDTVPATFDDGSTEKVIPGEGRYSVSPDGLVTFVPEADFVGQGSGVIVLRKDVNGTLVTAGFLPTVTDPSTGQDTASTGAKGQPQIGTPSFEGSIDTNVPPTFEDGSTELTVPGEGHYSIDKDGQVTFTPEPDFVGTAKGVVVKRLDIYGNPVTALYQPTVIGQTRVEDVTSEGYKGQTQTGQPIFEGDVDLSVSPTFDDGSTEKVIPGEGTYTLSPDGLVTFVPEPNFIGQATGVIVIRKDRNGNTISAAYKPLVTEIPVNPVTPPTPERPVDPLPTVKPAETPVKEPELPAGPAEPIFLDAKKEKAQLPNTGSKESSFTASALLAAVTGLSLFGLAKRKKSSDEE